MKTILLFIILFTISFSQELLTYGKGNKTYSYCVEDYYYKNNRLYFIKSSNPYYYTSINQAQYKNISFQSGYVYENNQCSLNENTINDYQTQTVSNINYRNLTQLGLSQNDFNLMMAFSGVCISFLFLFGLFRWI
mgnify:CR=1 FL=1